MSADRRRMPLPSEGAGIAPSLLSADFARLAEEVERCREGGADWLHLDVMDGHFVPNLTFGPPVVAAVRSVTSLPLDVHLMIETPERFIDAFVGAGADGITVHQEACTHLHRVVHRIRESGVRAGVAINPATPLEMVEPILPDVDLVLLMTVNPGFGGQRFIRSGLERARRLREMIAREGGAGPVIQVDGGVDTGNAPLLVEAGVRSLVAGSSVFGAEGGAVAGISALRRSIAGGRDGAR